MCLVVFVYGCSPVYRLLLLSNRDELWSRGLDDAAPLQWWHSPADGAADDPAVKEAPWAGGCDRIGGGSWLAVGRSGRIAVVTNFRTSDALKYLNARAPKLHSRGELVRAFVAAADPELSAESYAKRVGEKAKLYAPFNLLVGDESGLFIVQWHGGDGGAATVRQVPEGGVYGLSNGAFDEPWPKVSSAKSALERAAFANAAADAQGATDTFVDDLISIMADDTPPRDDRLPDTGIGLTAERKLSPRFVDVPEWKYGTVCTSVVGITFSGEVRMLERRFHRRDPLQETSPSPSRAPVVTEEHSLRWSIERAG